MRHLLPSGPSGLCRLLQSGKGGGAGLTRAFAQNPAAEGSSGAFLYRRKCADAQASPMPPTWECKTDDFNFLGTSKADMQVLAATLEKCRPCKSSGRAQQYLPATLGVNLWSRCQCCPAAGRVLVPSSPLLSSVFSWFAPGAAWVSPCPALVCPVPPHQIMALTVVALNKSFTLWLRGKDRTCIALLGKKGCKQKTEISI